MTRQIAILAGGAPAEDLAAADRVEVQERIGEPATFRLRYPLDEVDGDFPLLVDGRVGAGGELTVAASARDAQAVLVKGQVYGHRVHVVHGLRDAWVEIVGGDKSMEMDREIKAKAWSDLTVSDVVSAILSEYGLTPQVDSIATTHTEANHALVQRDTDLRFVRRLARRYGCWFRVDTDLDDVTTGYFQRPALDGEPAVTLTINGDQPTVSELDIEWDVERPGAAMASQLTLRGKQTLDGQVARSPLSPLGGLAFADVTAPRPVQIVAPTDDAGDLTARAEAALIDGGWFVRARGQTSAHALGSILRAHTVIAVGGLGTRHSGKYVVAAVRHVIDAVSHVMEFELVRNAWEA
jgi:hypothetical protein